MEVLGWASTRNSATYKNEFSLLSKDYLPIVERKRRPENPENLGANLFKVDDDLGFGVEFSDPCRCGSKTWFADRRSLTVLPSKDAQP